MDRGCYSVLLDAVIKVFFACFKISSESLCCACAYKLLVRLSENVLCNFDLQPVQPKSFLLFEHRVFSEIGASPKGANRSAVVFTWSEGSSSVPSETIVK
ncbi:hypothetical protein VNO80_25152 [Phaseolus coccineus]|uniref:Uncharacterized protein n=1 Tax=Phaseolus coccineus TaxID=3886 RepID=A0AAN9LY18_PHACN